jgi:hypothetical protein
MHPTRVAEIALPFEEATNERGQYRHARSSFSPADGRHMKGLFLQ